MNNEIIIDGFDPSTFEILEYGYVAKRKKLRKWMNKGYVLPAGRPFRNNKERHKVVQLIKMIDPMLAQICLLSYKYAKHPVYDIAVATSFSEPELTVGGVVRTFPITVLILDELECYELDPYFKMLVDCGMPLIMNPEQDIWQEMQSRWINIVHHLKELIDDSHNINIGSFFYTKVHEVVKNGMDVYDVAKLIGFPNVEILNALLISTGINLPWSIVTNKFIPPDPFEDSSMK